jgi:hypothetical protein
MNKPRTLCLSTGSFDQVNTFRLVVPGHAITCTVHRDYEKVGDGILWFMQRAGCLKSHYTERDRAEQERLREEEPVRHGDIVMVDGRKFRVRVLGDYSNAAVLDPEETGF